MKVQCPSCAAVVPAANISLDAGWGKCEACQDVFALADAVPGFRAPESQALWPVIRPYNARARVERTIDMLQVHVPAEGMRAATFGRLGFAIFWLGFIAFWTAGALGVLVGQPPEPFNWLFAAFSIPFWIAGFVMLAAVVWHVCGIKAVQIDREGMWTHQRCLGWSQSRWIEIDRVQRARHYDPKVKSSARSPHALEIVYRAGSFVLPADSGDEEKWLIGEINDFVKSLAGQGAVIPADGRITAF
jgi:hypothetical protein